MLATVCTRLQAMESAAGRDAGVVSFSGWKWAVEESNLQPWD
jgi:hypothetical protein